MNFMKFFTGAISVPESKEIVLTEPKKHPEKENKGVSMSYENERCERPNYGNDLVYLFGTNKGCREENHSLETVGGTGIGYAINKGLLTDIKINWSGKCDASEVIVVQKNGQDIAWTLIEGKCGTKCVQIKEEFCDCDIINVVSRAQGVQDPTGEPGKWVPAGCITVALWYTPYNHIKPKCTTGVIEAINTDGAFNLAIPNVWTVKPLDTVRNNTIPAYASFSDTDDAIILKTGVYAIEYGSQLEFYQSVNVVYSIQLEVDDGTGWVAVPYSLASTYTLGVSPVISTNRSITYAVPANSTYKFRIVERLSDDTATKIVGSGGYIIADRQCS
jgi:hypothetical protein